MGVILPQKIGDKFHQETKYERGKLPRHRLDWSTKPPVFKTYSGTKSIPLPEPQHENDLTLWEVLTKRRSKRAYTKDMITLEQLSQILWATQGITARVSGHALRTAPSAGALYPIETYLWVNRVSTLEQGLYHYAVQTHELELLKKGDFSKEVTRGALDQGIAGDAAITFIWSAVIERSRWKYLQRAYRYIFIDAGHIAQNLALAAEAVGLGSCQIGAIYDDEMNSILDLDGIEESVIYMSSVAHTIR
jgi:SagB-type dehydrogenase family enzyme